MGDKPKEIRHLLDAIGLEDLSWSAPVLDDNQMHDHDDPKIPAEFYGDIQLQEAIFSSMQVYRRTSNSSQYLELEDDGAGASRKSPDMKQKGISSCKLEPLVDESWIWSRTRQRGEASWSVCVICGDDQPTGKMKRLFQCGHFTCEDCMTAYAGKIIQKNIHEEVKCPGEKCKKTWSESQCLRYLPREVADQYFEARREAKVLARHKYIQCPFEDCRRLFLDDRRGFLIRACPVCWRIFCMECRTGWHMGLSCYEFQMLPGSPLPLLPETWDYAMM